MAKRKVYIVHEREIAEAPIAVFDSKDKVLQYTKRFKRNRRYIVFEQELNPPFVIDTERIPYEVAFETGGEVRMNRAIANEDVDLATKGGYEIDDTLYCYTLAKDESEALKNALEIKEQVIARGEWEYTGTSDPDVEFE